MTALKRIGSESGSKHALVCCIVGLSRLVGRHIGPYTCGIVLFTQLSSAPLFDELRHQAGELQEIGDSEDRTALAKDDLWIGCDDVGPLPRHRADAILVDTQQEPRPVPVVPLADTDELPAAERVERVGHAHKARVCVRRARSSG